LLRRLRLLKKKRRRQVGLGATGVAQAALEWPTTPRLSARRRLGGVAVVGCLVGLSVGLSVGDSVGTEL
jgi:hypothetical protein